VELQQMLDSLNTAC